MRFSLFDRFAFSKNLLFAPALAPVGEAKLSSVMFSTPGSYPPGDPGYTPPAYTPPPGYTTPPPPGYVPPPSGQTGLSVNSASALCYVLGLITGIIFLVLEPYKRDRTIRFHAFQSIFLNIAVVVIWVAWGIVASALTLVSHGLFVFVALLVNLALSLAFLILWIMLLIRAAQGQRWVLPVVGPLAEKQAASGSF